ncbi:DUF805 domain-containing protein [Vibrio nigripulchritudo]|uniref:DUF805 domain-containing protein n=1 Tax=Vibrio nigripulchritudo TaxID=28173 RepID=UPI00190AC59D|nr:DUF805 domain-containing protein [Vibrio nigripulchritudo]
MEWYLAVLKKYTVFEGRARRKEYWMFILFNAIFTSILGLIDKILGIEFLGIIYGLALIVPGIAVNVRRLHDIGRTGWWVLIALVPFIGWAVLIIFAATEGVKGSNEYGADPKSTSETVFK